MKTSRLVFLVEEPSMEAFLSAFLPRFLPRDMAFETHSFQGKVDLLGKIEKRLRAYATWIPSDWRLIVLVDRDNDSCVDLKSRLESIASQAGFGTTTSTGDNTWRLANRIVIEELEAWYFGDWAAVHKAYPRTSASLPAVRKYRDPDVIAGGTWEAFEREMRRFGYFKGGLEKISAARALGDVIDPARSVSKSFQVFWNAVVDTFA